MNEFFFFKNLSFRKMLLFGGQIYKLFCKMEEKEEVEIGMVWP